MVLMFSVMTLIGPTPPSKAHQGTDLILGEAVFDVCCGVSADDGVVRHVFVNHRSGRDNRSVTDAHSGQDCGISTDPDAEAKRSRRARAEPTGARAASVPS
jgi:hypothetical protein